MHLPDACYWVSLHVSSVSSPYYPSLLPFFVTLPDHEKGSYGEKPPFCLFSVCKSCCFADFSGLTKTNFSSYLTTKFLEISAEEAHHIDAQIIARTENNRYTAGVEYNKAKDSGELTEEDYLGYAK